MFAENVGFIPGTVPLFLLPPAQLVRSPRKEIDLLQHDFVEFAGWAADRKAHILEGLFRQSQAALVDGKPSPAKNGVGKPRGPRSNPAPDCQRLD